MLRASTLSFVPVGVIEVTSGIGVVLIVLAGGAMALDGAVSAADLFVFIVYLTQIYQPFLQLANINDTLQKATVSSERVFELLDIQPDIVSPPDAVRPTEMHWDIVLQDVTFAYQPDRPVLSEVSIQIPEGAMVALVGATGAGKTTVTNLGCLERHRRGAREEPQNRDPARRTDRRLRWNSGRRESAGRSRFDGAHLVRP